MWSLEWGPHEKLLLAKDLATQPGQALDKKPTLAHELIWIWEAYLELHSFGDIRTSDVVSWLDLHEITEQDTKLEFYYLIRMMNQAEAKYGDSKGSN